MTRHPSHGAVVGCDAGVVQHATTLNRFGRIISREERRAGASRVFDYSYDVTGRLVVVEEDGVVSATYSYDDNGNRDDAVVDEQDRLLSLQGWELNTCTKY